MDDILNQLSEFLSTSEGQEQLKNIAAMFSGGEQNSESGQSGENGGAQKAPESPKDNAPNNILPDGMSMDMIMKLAPVISKLGHASDDKNSQLIMALKPHLKPENRHRADEAAQFLKLLTLLPYLKDLDLF